MNDAKKESRIKENLETVTKCDKTNSNIIK